MFEIVVLEEALFSKKKEREKTIIEIN